jgi:hypothetical protein
MEPVWLWIGLLPVCGAVGWVVLRVPLRSLWEAHDALKARDLFRRQREWLESRFLSALARAEPLARVRWEDADWRDEVVWARDRRTRRFLALVGVKFEANPFDDDELPDHATALFEYYDHCWHAEGGHLDAVRPSEAFLRHRQLEPVDLPRVVRLK